MEQQQDVQIADIMNIYYVYYVFWVSKEYPMLYWKSTPAYWKDIQWTTHYHQ